MELDATRWTLTIAAGVASGFINTLSGGGSYLVLPLLLGLGLDSHAANATNRVGVLMQSLVGFRTFQKSRPLPRPLLLRLSIPMVLGGIVGASIAVKLDSRVLDIVIGALLVLLLGLVLWKPERFLKPPADPPSTLRPHSYVIMFSLGVYGGFIQAGIGLFLLAALVLDLGLGLVSANAAKLLLVLLITLPALAIFGAAKQVVWPIGLALGVGQSLGAFVAARFATRKAEADKVIRWLLLIVLPATAIKLWFFSGH